MLETSTKRRRGGRVKGSLRDIGEASLGVDKKTRNRIRILAGSLPICLWLRRLVDKHYTRYLIELASQYEILGIDENEEPLLGKPLREEPAGEPVEEDPERSSEPCDLTDIENWKKDYQSLEGLPGENKRTLSHPGFSYEGTQKASATDGGKQEGVS